MSDNMCTVIATQHGTLAHHSGVRFEPRPWQAPSGAKLRVGFAEIDEATAREHFCKDGDTPKPGFIIRWPGGTETAGEMPVGNNYKTAAPAPAPAPAPPAPTSASSGSESQSVGEQVIPVVEGADPVAETETSVEAEDEDEE